jgi:hypothetical protein
VALFTHPNRRLSPRKWTPRKRNKLTDRLAFGDAPPAIPNGSYWKISATAFSPLKPLAFAHPAFKNESLDHRGVAAGSKATGVAHALGSGATLA